MSAGRLAARVVVAGLLLGACAGAPGRPDYPLISEDDDPAARAAGIGQEGAAARPPAARPASPAPPRTRGPLARSGSIRREELDAVLDAGPGAFLRGVQVDAQIVERRLRGWRIRTFWPDDARFARVDLLPGDVVLSINGRLVVRPEHLQRVWDSLREATTLVVEVDRDGAVYRLEYTIVDSPPLPGSNTGP